MARTKVVRNKKGRPTAIRVGVGNRMKQIDSAIRKAKKTRRPLGNASGKVKYSTAKRLAGKRKNTGAKSARKSKSRGTTSKQETAKKPSSLQHPRMQGMPKEYQSNMANKHYAQALQQHRLKGHTWESAHSYAKKVSGRIAGSEKVQKALSGYKAHKPTTTIHENRSGEVAKIKAFRRVEGMKTAGAAKAASGFRKSAASIGQPTPAAQQHHQHKQALHQVMSKVQDPKQKLRLSQQIQKIVKSGGIGKLHKAAKIGAAIWGKAHDVINKGITKTAKGIAKGAGAMHRQIRKNEKTGDSSSKSALGRGVRAFRKTVGFSIPTALSR